ncbi:amidohydrolase family protein [Planosporangium thailandense]|uniref:Amidohydrolase family protein n=1 Tax=Planosporangium thailandense TaxID=765197 RepID=A0ABX0Y6A5_9ACTN|nr:amidohydrolase family protein [Planosporangium thailandense]NJC73090.1 amidohydrolase family protein [Planosporangium thailandense]
MSEISPNCPPPVDNPKRPGLALPAFSCDSHCHVFGPSDIFPFAPERTFTPVDVPRQRLRRLHDFLGFDRAVIVQSACHGTDHAALLDALETSGGRYRGVALVTPTTNPDEIARLDAAGVCGARLNFLPHLGGAPSKETMDAVLRLVRPYGWHISVHVAGTGITDYADFIRTIDVPVVIDHMARVDVRDGLDTEHVASLLALLDTGNVWVKLSGVDRLSARSEGPYESAVVLAALLARHAPDRVVWGTDFPHPNITGSAPDDGVLVDLIAEIAPDEGLRHKLLVTNPAELFRFRQA